MDQAESLLWERYLATKDEDARDQLIRRHVGLVYKIARSLARQLSTVVEFEDLVSSGMIGMLKALEKFEQERGGAFSTYAVPRIRGAILDDIRARDLAPRSARRREREVETARGRLLQKLKREPTEAEIAEEAGLDASVLWRWREAMNALQQVSMDQSVFTSEDEGATLADVLANEDEDDAQAALEREEKLAGLRSAIDQLPAQQRHVLALYYYEDLKLSEIGEVLNVSESRISQVRSLAIKNLKAILAGQDPVS